ncbi:MAG: DUF302 domain-containing protein [Tolypothrix brevis GSE-NOS-MK-07-07A]|jgi:uncharacterized protein (DUF302 family)|nr:DUF302 domain-containing protein [Tolypothrix brevis GSE-NOS-MK-07-07A]
MKKILLGLLALGLIVIPAYASKGMNKKANNGIVRVKSAFSVSETTERFESVAQQQGLKIVAKIDHAAGAKSINQELRPTQLIIFGNPATGTPLMQCNQTVGIDLPQKALIWQDEQGQVWFGYNSPKYLMARHQLKGCGEEAIQKIDNALSMLAQKVTQ